MLFARAALGCQGAADSEAGVAAAPTSAAPASPLATLDPKRALEESWTLDGATSATSFLFFAREGLRLSASCTRADGSLDCAALKYVRSGMPTEIAKRELDGRGGAGAKVCLKMKQVLVPAKNSVGSEETFCKFDDGSLIAASALEQYSLRVIQ